VDTRVPFSTGLIHEAGAGTREASLPSGDVDPMLTSPAVICVQALPAASAERQT